MNAADNVHAANAMLHGVQAHNLISWQSLNSDCSNIKVNSLKPKSSHRSLLLLGHQQIQHLLFNPWPEHCTSHDVSLGPAPYVSSLHLCLSRAHKVARPQRLIDLLHTPWAHRLNLGSPDAVKGRRLLGRQAWGRGTGQHWAGQHLAGSTGHAGHLLRLCLALVAQDSENESCQLPIERSRPASKTVPSHIIYPEKLLLLTASVVPLHCAKPSGPVGGAWRHTDAMSLVLILDHHAAHLSRSCSRAAMKKCTACAFSSTRKDRRPKKWTIPLIPCSMDCHALGGGGGGLAASKGAPGHYVTLSRQLHLDM